LKNRLWQGKLAAGFTKFGGLSGDKLAVLQQLNIFAMQHGMLWSAVYANGSTETDLIDVELFRLDDSVR
jgi:NAD(P)H dehydrogenase (quinone)